MNLCGTCLDRALCACRETCFVIVDEPLIMYGVFAVHKLARYGCPLVNSLFNRQSDIWKFRMSQCNLSNLVSVSVGREGGIIHLTDTS